MKTRISSARYGALWGGIGALSCAAVALAGGKGKSETALVRIDAPVILHKNPLALAIASGASSEGGIAGATPDYATCFEAPAYAIGALNGQNSWTVFAANATGPNVSASGALEGAQVVTLATGAGAATSLNGGFSPVIVAPADRYVAEMRVLIPELNGPSYQFITQTPAQGFLSSRVFFSPDGDIDVLAGAPLAQTDTGTNWTPGVAHTLKLVISPATNWIDYYLDGTPIYRGTMVAGTAVQQGILCRTNVALPSVSGEYDCYSSYGVLDGCVTDIVPNNITDIDDLLAVIGGWGPCPAAPIPCISNINNTGASAGLTNIDDLLSVISFWGACSVPTGACCTPSTGACADLTPAACAASGGIFQGFFSTCATTTCPAPIPNDECSGAIAIPNSPLPVSVAFSNANATSSVGYPGSTGGPASVCTSLTNNVQNDLWYSFQTVAGVTYVVDTLTSPVDVDTTLQVFADCTPGSAELNCNDDVGSGPLLSSMQVFGNDAVQFIRVGMWGANPTVAGSANVVLRISVAP